MYGRCSYSSAHSLTLICTVVVHAKNESVPAYDGDLVLVPAARLDDVVEVLQQAGHQVSVRDDEPDPP